MSNRYRVKYKYKSGATCETTVSNVRGVEEAKSVLLEKGHLKDKIIILDVRPA